MNILFLDVETTGTDPDRHSIIEVALEFHKNGERISNWGKRFCPEEPYDIDLGALKVNGASLSGFESRGDVKLVINGFVDYLLGLPQDKGDPIILCGHNVSFDVMFIKSWLKKHKIYGIENIITYRVLDTATIATFLQSVGLLNVGKTSLKNLAKELEVKLPDKNKLPEQKLHNANVDVKITAEVFYKMQKLLETIKLVAEEAQLQDEE